MRADPGAQKSRVQLCMYLVHRRNYIGPACIQNVIQEQKFKIEVAKSKTNLCTWPCQLRVQLFWFCEWDEEIREISIYLYIIYVCNMFFGKHFRPQNTQAKK